MTSVLSALVLLPVVIGTIWFLPPCATLVLALIAAVLAFGEYRDIARALGVRCRAASAASPSSCPLRDVRGDRSMARPVGIARLGRADGCVDVRSC